MHQDTPADSLHNVFEATQLLGKVSPWTIFKHIREGKVTAVKLGRRVFVRQDEIDRIRREGLPPLRPRRA